MLEKENLLKEWIKFKKAETKAKKNRTEIEKQIEPLYSLDPEKKSKTFKEEDLGFNINIKKNIVYKLDNEAWISIRSEIPESLRPEKISFSLDLDGFKYLKESKDDAEQDIYKKVSNCVEKKENKTTITVEKIK